MLTSHPPPISLPRRTGWGPNEEAKGAVEEAGEEAEEEEEEDLRPSGGGGAGELVKNGRLGRSAHAKSSLRVVDSESAHVPRVTRRSVRPDLSL